jgi:3-hydroxy acid dehydrogenase / malonic semialdehyde reductase
MSLQGRLALVTGASSGIGEACARRLAAEGADLVLWARRADRLDAVATAITQDYGTRVRQAIVDVRDRAAVESSVARLIAAGTVPDILINNAGLASGFTRFHEGDPDDWDRMIDTNIKGLLYVSRAVVPHMIAAGRGHLINLGSAAAHTQYPRGNVYAATKFAVRALSEGMNLDLVDTPVRVTQIDPGFVETEFSIVRFHGSIRASSRRNSPLYGSMAMKTGPGKSMRGSVRSPRTMSPTRSHTCSRSLLTSTSPTS